MATGGTAECTARVRPRNVAVTNIPIRMSPGFSTAIGILADRIAGSRIAQPNLGGVADVDGGEIALVHIAHNHTS